MINESIKILSDSGYVHPYHGRTIYMSSEKQKNYFRYHIAEIKKHALNYNKVVFGPDNQNSTVDMVIQVDGIFKRAYITFYPGELAKKMFPHHQNKVKQGVFTFHIENFNGIIKK